MGRRAAAPESATGELSEDEVRRRFRTLELRLVLSAGGKDAGEQLRRKAAKVNDPSARLKLGETAYLSVFDRLPYGADA